MYRIVDLEGFSELLRGALVDAYGCEGRHLTVGQIVSFVRERFPEEDGETVFDEEGLKEIVDLSVGIMLGSCMSSMAVDGELECAWDEKSNDMVWWLPGKE